MDIFLTYLLGWANFTQVQNDHSYSLYSDIVEDFGIDLAALGLNTSDPTLNFVLQTYTVGFLLLDPLDVLFNTLLNIFLDTLLETLLDTLLDSLLDALSNTILDALLDPIWTLFWNFVEGFSYCWRIKTFTLW